MAKSSPRLLEASWEVCNKVGGIYTVITSKLSRVLKHYPDAYLAVGPYLSSSNPTFSQQAPPEYLVPVIEQVEKKGIKVYYGTWLVEGEPPTILLNWDGLLGQLNNYKFRFWEDYQLDTLGSNYYDLDQPLLWSIAVGLFASALAEQEAAQNKNNKVILQLHEWMAGGATLALGKQKHPSLRTVFTTHATVLGRALSSQGVPIYNQLQNLNPEAEAKKINVSSKHQLEKLSANLADVFTTVSQITAEEAEAFLGRKAEVVTENGLDTEAFPAFDVLCHKRQISRRILDDFVSAYFFPSYQFALENTVYQFTMGRYEVHNKGYDVYLQALGELNHRLKESKSQKTLVSFLLVPGDVLRIRPDTLAQLAVYGYIRQELDNLTAGQERKLYLELCQNQTPGVSLPAAAQAELRQLMARLSRSGQPAISPFDLRQNDLDAVLQLSKQYGLLNREEDRVKVLFFPIYFDGFDGIFNLPFYDIIAGFDLGVFPSFYEPWGYTPMESLTLGVPAVTSNLAGFGRSIAELGQQENPGFFILDRRHQDEQTQENLVRYLNESLEETPRDWLDRRISAYQTAQKYSWNNLFENYRKAYEED